MLISATIPNLINGVSQQAENLRLASQADAQENYLSSITKGLVKRPGTSHIANLSASPFGTTFLHSINRDAVEQYIVAATGDGVYVWEAATGVLRTVNTPDGLGYLAGASKSNTRALTVADYTFIVNQSVVPAMLGTTTATPNPEGLVYCRSANYGRTYEVYINGSVQATYATPDGGSASHSLSTNATAVADDLYNDLVANLNGSEWTVTLIGNTIHIVNILGNDFTLATKDGAYNVDLKSVKDKVQRFTDLPEEAPDGIIFEVQGDQTSAFDNYYVVWDGSTGVNNGTWKETIAPGTVTSIDPATMPHILVRESNGDFTFKQATWGGRTVGDATAVPDPSFIGQTITDVFFYRNRLGFLSGENVIFSRGAEFFEFFPKTVVTVLDTDPIDVAVSHTKVSTLRHAIPFQTNLLLFSDRSQFIIEGGSLLTPKTISADQSSEFEVTSLGARPLGVGKFIYFGVDRGSYTGIREYSLRNDLSGTDAADITSHAPRYIPAGLSHITAAENQNIICFLTDGDPDGIYVYKYYWGEEGKLQSSISRWTFPSGSIRFAEFMGSKLYLVVEYGAQGTFLEVLDVDAGAVDEGSTIQYHVDRKIYESDMTSVTFDGANTNFWLPYSDLADKWVFIRAGSTSAETKTLSYTQPLPNLIVVEGNYSTEKVCIGLKIRSEYDFSTFAIKEAAVGGGQSSVGVGRLQLSHLSVDYFDTGYFEVRVTPTGREEFIYPFTGAILGAESSEMGTYDPEQGRFRAPVMARNGAVRIRLFTDHFLPCSLVGAEWEGRYIARSRRLS